MLLISCSECNKLGYSALNQTIHLKNLTRICDRSICWICFADESKTLNRKIRSDEIRAKKLEIEKQKSVTIENIVYDKVTCKYCNNIKLRFKKDSDPRNIYRDENNRRWEGRKCPDCLILKYKKDNSKRKIVQRIQQCIYCNKDYTPQRKSSRFCSKKCFTNSLRKEIKSPRKRTYKAREKKIYDNINCRECNKLFTPKSITGCYCSNKCSRIYKLRILKSNYKPSKSRQKHYNKLRKRSEMRAKLKSESWSTIEFYYANKPEGYHIDHIIPLNHPDVCGLHNTWNFQYLSPEDNSKKSNNFDGTYDNNGWKNIY